MKNEPLLKKVYGEILAGRTAGQLEWAGQTLDVYIRHFNPLDQARIDTYYLEFFNQAREVGIKTEEERLVEAINGGFWDVKKDDKINGLKSELHSLNKTRDKLFLSSDLKVVQESIDKKTKEINLLLNEKYAAIGETAEQFCNKRLNDLYIFASVYRGEERLVSEREFKEMDDEEMGVLVRFYNSNIKDFSDYNIKNSALLPSFQNYLSICGDDITRFFGKPVVDLTFYQCELLSYGRFFKHVLNGERKPPPHCDDADKLISWYNDDKKTQQMKDSVSGKEGNVGMVGATAEESAKLAGSSDNFIDFSKLAAEKGGKLRKEDLLGIIGG